MASKNYSSQEVDIGQLIIELREFFVSKNYRFQPKEGPAGGVVLDANKSGNPRDLLGLSLALTVRVTAGPEVTRVWIGNQKWVDKVLVAFVGLVLFVGLGSVLISRYGFDLLKLGYLLLKIFSVLLIILPAVGAYLQYKITQDTWKAIADHEALRLQQVLDCNLLCFSTDT